MNESQLSDEALAELLTLMVTVDKRGSIKYRNQQGRLHRVHGPASTWPDGSQIWHQWGSIHRTDGPAAEYADGSKAWYLNGEHITESEFNERIKSI